MNLSIRNPWLSRLAGSLAYLWGRTAFLRYASPKDWAKSVAIIAAFMTVASATSAYGLFLDLSEIRCMPEYLYAASPRNDADLKHGDVVSFVAAMDEMLGLMAGKRIAKVVMAMQGDHVISNGEGVTINGKFVAVRSDESLANIAKKGATPISSNKVLERGEIFVMGTLPRSFDSRYWGTMKASHVDKFVKPII